MSLSAIRIIDSDLPVFRDLTEFRQTPPETASAPDLGFTIILSTFEASADQDSASAAYSAAFTLRPRKPSKSSRPSEMSPPRHSQHEPADGESRTGEPHGWAPQIALTGFQRCDDDQCPVNYNPGFLAFGR